MDGVVEREGCPLVPKLPKLCRNPVQCAVAQAAAGVDWALLCLAYTHREQLSVICRQFSCWVTPSQVCCCCCWVRMEMWGEISTQCWCGTADWWTGEVSVWIPGTPGRNKRRRPEHKSFSNLWQSCKKFKIEWTPKLTRSIIFNFKSLVPGLIYIL